MRTHAKSQLRPPMAVFKDEGLERELQQEAIKRTLPAGAVLLRSGDAITHIPIVQKGSLRIVAQDDEGRERFLYHIMPGETCAMTLMCCGAHRKSMLVAIAEEDAELLLVPVRCAEEWMRWPEWRRYVGEAQAQRFMELLETIEVVAFRRLDEQLWNYLVKRTQALGAHELRVTHQEMATELNSPREVITRLLHQLEQQGRVTLARGTITVLSPAV